MRWQYRVTYLLDEERKTHYGTVLAATREEAMDRAVASVNMYMFHAVILITVHKMEDFPVDDANHTRCFP